MRKLSKNVFYVFHEEIVIKADRECGGLRRDKDFNFYGEGSGANEPKSIAVVVNDYLEKTGYHYEHFSLAPKGEKHIFNGSILRKAKGRYNRIEDHEMVEIEEMYVDAFLAFLGKSMEDLESLAKEYDIQEEIDHTESIKPKRRKTIKKLGRADLLGAKLSLLEKHIYDDFYLYSYNEEEDKIFQAILEIRLKMNKIRVDLINPTAYDYGGLLDYNFMDNYNIIITLKTAQKNKGLYILLSVDLNDKNKALIYQGQMLRYGTNTETVSSDVFIERINQETREPKIYEMNDPDMPDHVRIFFDPPVYNKVDKVQFTNLEDFMKWAKKKSSR